MAGLLDFLATPESDLGIRLLAAANSGQGFGAGLLGAVQGNQQMRRQMSEAEFERAKMQRQQQDWARQDKVDALASQFYRPGSAAVAPIAGDAAAGIPPSPGSPSVAPRFDMQGYAQAVLGVDPRQGLQLLQGLQKEANFDKVDPAKYTPASLAKFAQSRNYGDLVPRDKLEAVGDTLVNPYDQSNMNRVVANPNRPFSQDAAGNIIPNQAYQNYEIRKANAGAARTSNNISVNTEKSLLNSIAQGVGGQIDASLAGAKSAASTIGTLNNLDSALNSGKILAGPATKPAQIMLQLGSQLGLGGKSSEETLSNTRSAIQAMAQLELDASGQMKGQGSLTDAERALLRRAASGDINMSLPELKTLSAVSRKTAKNRIQQHNQNVQPLLQNPNGAAVAPFLTVNEPQSPPASTGENGGWKIIGVQ